MRKLIATVFNYSLDGLLAEEGTEYRQLCFGLPSTRRTWSRNSTSTGPLTSGPPVRKVAQLKPTSDTGGIAAIDPASRHRGSTSNPPLRGEKRVHRRHRMVAY